MKIHGKTLSEIFALLPWQYKIVMAASCAFLIYVVIYVPMVLFSFGNKKAAPHAIEIARMDRDVSGIADPSLGDGDGHTYLAFTALRPPAADAPLATTEILFAEGSSGCRKWALVNGGIPPKLDELVGPGGINSTRSGVWRVETPSLVFDPADKGREWKLYAYQYFWANDVPLARLYSMIVEETADEKTMQWTKPEWLFTAGADRPPAPYGSLVRGHINDLSPALSDVYFYARPSVVETNNVLLMALSAFTQGRTAPERVVLLASNDHGASWKYLGAPLSAADVRAPYTHLMGSTLIEKEGSIYLAAVMGNDASEASGTLIFSFDNLPAAHLQRDGAGAPVVFNRIPLTAAKPSKMGGGYAAYTDACKSGLFTGEVSADKGYGIYSTLRQPIDK